MLSIKNFRKAYGNTVILQIPEIHFKHGVYWIKGENGAGKSTLFKSLSGLIPSEGNISFDDDISLKQQPLVYQKLVNYSEAEPLYPGFVTAKDLIHFVGYAKGSSIDQQQYLLEKFNMRDYVAKPCETYSSGMLKKLSLVLAFLGDPRIIILDEPLITLDVTARETLIEEINKHLSTRKVTFLISSHQTIEMNGIPVEASYNILNKGLHLN